MNFNEIEYTRKKLNEIIIDCNKKKIFGEKKSMGKSDIKSILFKLLHFNG